MGVMIGVMCLVMGVIGGVMDVMDVLGVMDVMDVIGDVLISESGEVWWSAWCDVL